MTTPRIVVTGKIPEPGLELLSTVGEVWAWTEDEPIPHDVRDAQLANADAVAPLPTPCEAQPRPPTVPSLPAHPGLDKAARTPDTGRVEYERQQSVFRSQLLLAHELGRPVSVHCVKVRPDSYGDALAPLPPPCTALPPPRVVYDDRYVVYAGGAHAGRAMETPEMGLAHHHHRGGDPRLAAPHQPHYQHPALANAMGVPYLHHVTGASVPVVGMGTMGASTSSPASAPAA